MKRFFTNDQKGVSIITVILIIIGLVILANVFYATYMAYSVYTNRVPYSIATGGFGDDDELVDIDIHLGGKHKHHYPHHYPSYSTHKTTKDSFSNRFSQKRESSSFFSRFSSKYGRSRTGSFRTSSFFGGK